MAALVKQKIEDKAGASQVRHLPAVSNSVGDPWIQMPWEFQTSATFLNLLQSYHLNAGL